MLHLTLFDRSMTIYGFAPLSAAQSLSTRIMPPPSWNKALLDNAARPSGALVYSADGGNLSDEQFERLKGELESQFQAQAMPGGRCCSKAVSTGSRSRFRPRTWIFLKPRRRRREKSRSPRCPAAAARPAGRQHPCELRRGQPGFHPQTVLPHLIRVLDAFSHLLEPSFGPFRIEPDRDRIDVLTAERERSGAP